MKAKHKIIITDPWESYIVTNANILFKKETFEMLILFEKSITFKDKKVKYLLCKAKTPNEYNMIFNNIPGTYRIFMGYIDVLDEYNFQNFSYDNLRGNFLNGEIIIE